MDSIVDFSASRTNTRRRCFHTIRRRYILRCMRALQSRVTGRSPPARPPRRPADDGRTHARARDVDDDDDDGDAHRARACEFIHAVRRAGVGGRRGTDDDDDDGGVRGGRGHRARWGDRERARVRSTTRCETRDDARWWTTRRDGRDEITCGRRAVVTSSRRVVKTRGTGGRPRSVASIRSIRARPSLAAGHDRPGRGRGRKEATRGGTARRGARESIDGWMTKEGM